jgi:glycosyltransferase involved in cell wall biosynthesis
MPKVSIIIPTYNCEKFIDKTIQSVIDQTYKNWELIIVDDLSTDNSRKILNEWKNKNNKIRLILLNKNSGGPAHPKNIGILYATGEYIAYLDHDDEWLPEKIEKQINILENNPKIGIISCEGITIDENNNVIDMIKIKEVPENGVFPDILSTDFIASNSSMIIPKKVIDKIGKRDENKKIGIAEDREFEMRVASFGYDISVIHEALFKYRIHKNNSSKIGSTQGLNYAEANYKYLSFYKKYNSEYLIFNRLAREYLKLEDMEKSKKFIKLTIQQKMDFSLIIMYILLYFGKYGMKLGKNILNLRTKILYK